MKAAEKAASELGTLYGRPVRFVHPLRSDMRRIGGGAGYDLDSIVTLLPSKGGLTALVADLDAGRDLLSKMTPEDWKSLQDGYGLSADARALTTAQSGDLDGFLDLIADQLAAGRDDGAPLPLLRIPVALLKDREGLNDTEFLITWNNVVAETRNGRLRAEGFSSLIPSGDRLARETFTAAGAQLDLFPPLVRSVILNGGYRCASNHVRGARTDVSWLRTDIP